MALSARKGLAKRLRAILSRAQAHEPILDVDVEDFDELLDALDPSVPSNQQPVLRFLYDDIWGRYSDWRVRSASYQERIARSQERCLQALRNCHEAVRRRGTYFMDLLVQSLPHNKTVRDLVQHSKDGYSDVNCGLSEVLDQIRPRLNTIRLDDTSALKRIVVILAEHFTDNRAPVVAAALRCIGCPGDAEPHRQLGDDLTLCAHFREISTEATVTLLHMHLLDLSQTPGGNRKHESEFWQRAESDPLQLARGIDLLLDIREQTTYLDSFDCPWKDPNIAQRVCDLHGVGGYYDNLVRKAITKATKLQIKPRAVYSVLAKAAFEDWPNSPFLKLIHAKDLALASVVGYAWHGFDDIGAPEIFAACWRELLARTARVPLSPLGRTATVLNLQLVIGIEYSVLSGVEIGRLFNRARMLLRLPQERPAIHELAELAFEKRDELFRDLRLELRQRNALLKLVAVAQRLHGKKKKGTEGRRRSAMVAYPERIQECHTDAEKLVGQVYSRLVKESKKYLLRGLHAYRCEEEMPGEEPEFGLAIIAFSNAIVVEVRTTLLRQLKATLAGRNFLARAGCQDLDSGDLVRFLRHLAKPSELQAANKLVTCDLASLVKCVEDLEELRAKGRTQAAHAKRIDREQAQVLHGLLFSKQLLRRVFSALHASA